MYLYFMVPLWFWNGRAGGHVWERDWVEKTSQIPASIIGSWMNRA